MIATRNAQGAGDQGGAVGQPRRDGQQLSGPWDKSAIPMVTYARIIMGITNFRNVLNRPEAVTTIRQTISGQKDPIRMPNMMPMISLGTRAQFFFFFPCCLLPLVFR